jgi:hypothetical protein
MLVVPANAGTDSLRPIRMSDGVTEGIDIHTTSASVVMGPGVRDDERFFRSSTLNFSIPYPRPPNLSYPAPVLSNEGRFMRRSEVGQSESWPEGQPEGRCGARGHASQAWTRGALGNRPCPIRGAAFSGWTRRVKGGETCLDGELARACARKSGPRDEEVAAMERPKGAFVTTKARRSALHLPSKGEIN